MSNVKAVIIRRNSSGVMTNRVMTTPKRANLIQEGLRASDNMSMTLSAEHAVAVGDEIYYIQDSLDVTNLKAVWNFYGGFRDESGYEHDDVYTAPYTMPNCVHSLKQSEAEIDWKHKGYYKFYINTINDDKNGIEIEKKFKNNNTTSSKIPVMDMSGDFDMIFEFKVTYGNSNGDNMMLFDNYDHSTSGGKGLKISLNPWTHGITITADDGTTQTIMQRTALDLYYINYVRVLRLSRQSGVFKLYLDGVEKTLTNNTNSGNLNNNANIHLFKEYNESTSPAAYIDDTGFTGIPIQFRFYTDVLPDSEVIKLRSSKPVNTTMKFGGKIWKIDDRGNTKKLSCSSHSKELLSNHLSSSTFNATPTANIGNGKRTNNRYHNPDPSSTSSRCELEDIVQDILKFVDDGVYAYFALHPSTTLYGDFFAEGSLLDVLKVMMIMDTTDHMFVITPRKILFISSEIQTNHVISEANYDIINSGKDDTGTTNSMFTNGRKGKYTKVKNVSSNNTRYSWSDEAEMTNLENGWYVTPVIERVISVMRSNDSGATTTITGGSSFNITTIHNKIISLAFVDGTSLTSTQLIALQLSIDNGSTNHFIAGSGSSRTLIAYDASQVTEIFAEQNVSSGGQVTNSTFTTNTYIINGNNSLQFWNQVDATSTNPTHVYTVTYEYSTTYYKNTQSSTVSNWWATTQKYADTSNISENGLYHRNFNVPQLSHGLDIYVFNAAYVMGNRDINTRQTVRTSTLVNSLTVGQKVRFSRYDKKADTWSHTDQVVRSIDYSYPQTLTTIELGEYMFSGFDVEKQTVDSLRGLDSVSQGSSRY